MVGWMNLWLYKSIHFETPVSILTTLNLNCTWSGFKFLFHQKEATQSILALWKMFPSVLLTAPSPRLWVFPLLKFLVNLFPPPISAKGLQITAHHCTSWKSNLLTRSPPACWASFLKSCILRFTDRSCWRHFDLWSLWRMYPITDATVSSDCRVRVRDIHEHRAESKNPGGRVILHSHSCHQGFWRSDGHLYLPCKLSGYTFNTIEVPNRKKYQP